MESSGRIRLEGAGDVVGRMGANEGVLVEKCLPQIWSEHVDKCCRHLGAAELHLE
jgi:hypothetical protein